MSKRMFCVSFLLLVIGLFSAMTFSVNGQKASANAESSNADVKDEFIQKYKDVSALTAPERKAFFKNASAKDRSNLWKTHLALYFVKNPNLNNEQKDLILEAISVSTPELFEITARNSSKEVTLQTLTRRALEIFTKTEAAEIFGNLGGGTTEINLLQKYQDISAVSMLKRKSLFRNASAKDRSDLWRVHLALILAKQSKLSNEQREFLQEIISFATPELYQLLEDNSQTRAKVKSSAEWLLARALTLFSKQEAAEFFTKLGEQPNSVSYTIETDIVIDGIAPDCGCHRGFGDMCANGCIGTNCRYDSWGCGFMYVFSCNGTECAPN